MHGRIHYILMGLGSYFLMAASADTPGKKKAKFATMMVYFVQLAFNFAWSLIFFNAAQYMLGSIYRNFVFVLT
ncbi:tryptophan-rich sensory protein [Pseudobutyrivibrio sp. ACV-2]|uniref:tryptophan-rich sensory protein n=1 Tax=Pseudobutyrivibrio sp. ACV-2 TaxID=1520801 RepID=UPI00241E63E4|nr:tryptophan-rich sensory protein [Pseudobutyrivibrio sp. ACV-2]